MIKHAVVAFLVVLGLGPGVASVSAAPAVVSYRGLLLLPDGRMAPDDRYQVDFSIHDAPVGGSVLFVQRRTVHVTRGLYEVHLADEPGAPLLEALAGSERYLQLTVVSGGGLSDVVLSPRQRITSAPYALVAGTADSVESDPAPLPTGAIVLWDQATGCGGAAQTCPCGFSPASGFDTMTVRGATTAETPGANQGVTPADDTLTTSQLPSHTHDLEDAGEHRHAPDTPVQGFRSSGSGSAFLESDPSAEGYQIVSPESHRGGLVGDHDHTVQPAGDGGPHYHPFRTVLFCRKE